MKLSRGMHVRTPDGVIGVVTTRGMGWVNVLVASGSTWTYSPEQVAPILVEESRGGDVGDVVTSDDLEMLQFLFPGTVLHVPGQDILVLDGLDAKSFEKYHGLQLTILRLGRSV